MKTIRSMALAACCALVAAGLVGTGSASAFSTAHCGKSGVVITTTCTLDGESTEPVILSTAAGFLTCEKLTTTASIHGTVFEIETQSIGLDNCSFLGTFGVTVNLGTCELNFDVVGTMEITPAGCAITVSALTCTVTIKSQSGLAFSNFESMAGPPKGATVNLNVSNLVYSQSSGCPGGARTSAHGGSLSTRVTVRGTAPVGTFVDFTVV